LVEIPVTASAPCSRAANLQRSPWDLPLSMRKANLARLLARRPDGIFLSDFEQGEIGPDLPRKACEFGLEGLVSKHRDRPYQGARSKHQEPETSRLRSGDGLAHR
jgi:hypothetical protein